MFKAKDLFTAHHVSLLADWLDEKGELCLEIYIPYGGGSPTYYGIRSLDDVKHAISKVSPLEIQITIWKNYTKEQFEADQVPKDVSDLKWIYSYNDEVMYFSVHKNRNWTESFHKAPEKYSRQIEEWLR